MSPPSTSTSAAAKWLEEAERPAILVGPEAEPATAPLLELAERLGAAILTTPDALSLIDGRRTCGTFSFGASAGARRVMERADVVLAVSALGEFSCRLGEAFRERTIIQVTERVSDVGRNCEPTLSLVEPSVATCVERLRAALAELVPTPRAPWFGELVRSTTLREAARPRPGLIHPVAAICAVQAALPAAARVCLDVTSGALHAYEHLQLTTRQRAFSSIENGACMSEALLASLGVRLASDLPTLVLVGDWGFCMAPAELHTAVELGLDRYVILVWANAGGAFIGAGVEQQGIAVPDAAWRWRAPPDFAKLGRAHGARGKTARDAATLQRELARGLRGPGPTLIEAKIDPAVPVPAGDRFLTLGEARA